MTKPSRTPRVLTLNAQAMPKPKPRVMQAAPSLPSKINDDELALIPSNSVLIERSRIYEAELPALLQSRITQVREHFLTEVLPLLVGVQNGVADAVDVVKLSLKEAPDAGQYSALLSDLVRQAVLAKSLMFVAKYTDLDPVATQVYLQTYLAKLEAAHGSNNSQKIMSVLQQISDMHGQTQDDAQPFVRPLPEAKRDRRSNRGRARRDTPKEDK